jgi:hypothetical protein
MNRWHMPSRLAPAALSGLLVATLIGACGASTPTPPPDAYTMFVNASHATYDRVKLQVGVKTTGMTTGDLNIDPKSIEVVVDSKAGVGSFHLSLPTTALQIPAAQLTQLGITGSTLDLDLVVDKSGVYAKTPLAAALIPQLAALTSQQVTGDLTGWVRLATAADLATLTQAAGQAVPASPAPSAAASLDPAGLKTRLEQAGVTLTLVGTEQRNGADARHVTAAVDVNKLLASDFAAQLPAAQRAQLQAGASQGTLKADLWFNAASSAISEADFVIGEGSQTIQVTVLISDPGSTAIAAPTTYTEVPLVQMAMPLVQMLMKGGLPSN